MRRGRSRLHVAVAGDRAMVGEQVAAAQQVSSLPSGNGRAPRDIRYPIEGESPPTLWSRTRRPINR